MLPRVLIPYLVISYSHKLSLSLAGKWNKIIIAAEALTNNSTWSCQDKYFNLSEKVIDCKYKNK